MGRTADAARDARVGALLLRGDALRTHVNAVASEANRSKGRHRRRLWASAAEVQTSAEFLDAIRESVNSAERWTKRRARRVFADAAWQAWEAIHRDARKKVPTWHSEAFSAFAGWAWEACGFGGALDSAIRTTTTRKPTQPPDFTDEQWHAIEAGIQSMDV